MHIIPPNNAVIEERGMKEPLRSTEEIRKHLYLKKRPLKNDVILEAKKLLNSWTGELDAPTEELRMIEKLIEVVD